MQRIWDFKSIYLQLKTIKKWLLYNIFRYFPRACALLLHMQCSQCTRNQSGALCLRCRRTEFQSGKLPKIWGTSVLKAETASNRCHTAAPRLQRRGWGRKGSLRGELLTNDPDQEALLPGQIQLAISNFVLQLSNGAPACERGEIKPQQLLSFSIC